MNCYPIQLRPVVAVAAFAAAFISAPTEAQQPSPYVDLRDREIKALSPEQVEEYRSGQGMGLALAAELNDYPGPKHVLEMAAELELSAEQSRAVRATYDAMHAEASRVGAAIVEHERRLDALFAEGAVTRQSLRGTLDEIGRLQAELRYIHLAAHLEMRRLLTSAQVNRYVKLRGYEGAGDHDPSRHGRGHHR